MEQPPRILVVDDDRTYRDRVVAALDAARYATAACGSAQEGLRLAGRFLPDLVVMEMILDGEVVGRELARRLRSRGDPLLVFATLQTDLRDRLAALRAGADDVLVKPFAVDELIARVHAVLRRGGRLSSLVLEVGRLVVDEPAHRVVWAGAEVRLGARDFSLLAALARNAGRVLSKARLLDLVWGYDVVDENLVEVHISTMRRALGPEAARLIHTVRGVGYVLRDDTVDDEPWR
ncbi:MAG: response regulator transcription factor [Acidimicrobiales bacterium]